MMRDRKIRSRSDPARMRPNKSGNQRRDEGKKNSGAGAASRPHARQLCSAAQLEGSLRQMPDRLTAQDVSRLNAKRVERPEIRFRNAKQGPPSEPAQGDDDEEQKRGAESVQFQDAGEDAANPCRHAQRG